MRTPLITLSLLAAVPAFAAEPWQYRGIYLGARTTPAEIMRHLNVDKFNTYSRSPINIFDPKNRPDLEAHGHTWIFEKLEFELGPHCVVESPSKYYCVNPLVGGGDESHGVVKVDVFVRHGVVSSIDLQFDSIASDEFFGVVFRKFGRQGWKQGQGETHIGIVDPADKDKTPMFVDRQIWEFSTQRYSAFMTDYDIIFVHYMPMYQGSFEMKLLDQDL